MNVTIALDDQLVSDARRVAASRGLSLNAMIREELQRVTSGLTGQEMLEELEELFEHTSARPSAWTWNREELYDRPILR